MEAVIGDTQQEGCLLSLKEDKREMGGVRRGEMDDEWERGKMNIEGQHSGKRQTAVLLYTVTKYFFRLVPAHHLSIM